MSRLIINASNLKTGGALQVATSFLEGLKNFEQNNYFVFLPPILYDSIKKESYSNNITFYQVENPPVIPVFSSILKKLSLLEDEIKPDCVFSLFGPTYWKPKSWHVMGFANGLYLYDDLPYIKKLSGVSRLVFNLKKNYHRLLLKTNADLYVVQNNDMKKRFANFLNISLDRVAVNYGSYHPVFKSKIYDINLLPSKKEDEFWFVTISSYYPHKNLDIINKVLDILSLKDIGVKVRFVLTLPHDTFREKFNQNDPALINVGPVNLKDCPYLYDKSDALFLPTLVESFSASYPEAMIMKKPILTSDYQFSRSVCFDSALYFDPYDPKDIVNKIIQIVTNKDLQEQLINKGLSRVKSMQSFLDMTKSYLDICESVTTKEHSTGHN